METSQNTEHKTVVPADLYDEMLTDTTPPEPNARLRAAAVRARKVVVRQPADH